jgi:quercetin dioxygenase-like cupin family protein
MGKYFYKDVKQDRETVAVGITRKIVGYDQSIMMVKVAFEKVAIGNLHTHFHSQTTSVASGVFEVSINGEEQILKAGDCFFTASDVEHGVVCIEAGELIDVFSPVQEDFL